MKQKKLTKKLALNRETVSTLTDREMHDVVGATLYQSDCASCTTCVNQVWPNCRSIMTGCYPNCTVSPCPM